MRHTDEVLKCNAACERAVTSVNWPMVSMSKYAGGIVPVSWLLVALIPTSSGSSVMDSGRGPDSELPAAEDLDHSTDARQFRQRSCIGKNTLYVDEHQVIQV